MNTDKYTENELHLMSYQELRRLSTLLQLPANIKKEYMISMIQAHQKGDGCTKIAIANKIMEERKEKRLGNKAKHPQPFIMSPPASAEQIPTDLSVSTKHEFKTRFSYIAHYTSKDNMSSGISRIVKQKAEVSRRNRSFLHHSRKPTKKLSTVGRTEIELPRNHSLTTPVRLMPQYERGFGSTAQYEAPPGLTATKSHFQEGGSYNYHFHGEYSNTLLPSSTHEICRNEAYWPARDMYNNSLMPILSSLLSTNPVTVNSTSYSSQCTSQSLKKGSSSFQQGVYEKYIKSGSLMETQEFHSDATNSSTLIVNNHFPNDYNNNAYNINHGCRGYLITKSDIDFEINSTLGIDYQQIHRRENAVIRNSNDIQSCESDFYSPKNGDSDTPQVSQFTSNVQDYSQCNMEYIMMTKNSTSVPIFQRSFETSPVMSQESVDLIERKKEDHEKISLSEPSTNSYESVYVEDKFWEESDIPEKKIQRGKLEKDIFVDGFLSTQTEGSFLSEISENSTEFSLATNINDPLAYNIGKQSTGLMTFSRCRYHMGHNKHPEATNKSAETSSTLPSFLSTFCTHRLYNRAYSLCGNSFTGTTETHLNPIMTCTYATQFNSHSMSQQTNSNNQSPIIQRQWLYSYPEPQTPFSVEEATYTTWDEYANDMGNKILSHNNGHEVQVVKCRKRGYHYLYSVANPCE